MRQRIWLFWWGLPLGSRLMFVAVFVLLGYWASIDIRLGLWKMTLPLIAGAIVVSKLLLPRMMAHPESAQRCLSLLGLMLMGAYYVFQREAWWHTVLAHLGRTVLLWFQTSCYFWLVSELKRQELQFLEALNEFHHDPSIDDHDD